MAAQRVVEVGAEVLRPAPGVVPLSAGRQQGYPRNFQDSASRRDTVKKQGVKNQGDHLDVEK